MVMSGPGVEKPKDLQKYSIRILHLRPPSPSDVVAGAASEELWGMLHLKSIDRPSAGRASLPAPQTLIVERAPPDLKLKQAIPLPIAVSWRALQALPPNEEHVRLDAKQAPAPEPSPPKVNVISLPEPTHRAPDAVVIPMVNQSDAPDSQGRESAGSASIPVAQADLAEVRVGGDGADPNLVRIKLPPDSKPQAVILGESPQIPGRIVSTVFISVGLPKNWTLEYWTPGNSSAPDAPWPYTMFRPNITLPAEANALLVRGLLTVEGRLEQLAMLAPAELAQKDSLFQALGQWIFRPAAKNGQAVAVEVLMVIPRQPKE
jgi:hypothetical protein